MLLVTGLCGAAELFLVSAQGGNSTNEVYRYSVAGPTSAATYRLTIRDPRLLQPFGVAFDTAGEMFVTNRASFGGTPSMARSIQPLASSPVFDSTYTDSTFHFPMALLSGTMNYSSCRLRNPPQAIPDRYHGTPFSQVSRPYWTASFRI